MPRESKAWWLRRLDFLASGSPAAELSPLSAVASGLRTKAFLYSALGFAFGLALTAVGYLVDYYALYRSLPHTLSLATIQGLHDVTPVHFFMDGFALILALAGGIAG